MLGKRWLRNSLVYGGVLVAIVALVVVFFRPSTQQPEEPISTLIADMQIKRISRIEVNGSQLEVERLDGTRYESTKEQGVSIFEVFAAANIDTTGVEIEIGAGRVGDWVGLLLNFLPLLFFVGLIVFLVRRGDRRQ
jgi:ATP-dependent Zn protease